MEELKEKKFDALLVNNNKQLMEKAKKDKIDGKMKRREMYKRILKENDLKQKLLKEKLRKEKENDKLMCQERMKMDRKLENERNTYYEQIKRYGNRYDMKQAEEIVERLKKEQKDENDLIQYYYDAKRKEADEKAANERLRKTKERQEMKKFLDMQIEEKKKEEDFIKLLDEEQARIWNMDCKRFLDDERKINKNIKILHKKNFECLMKQIEEKKKVENNQNIMSENEYAMNREILENAGEEEKLPFAE